MRRWRGSPGGSSTAATASVRTYVVRGSPLAAASCTVSASVTECDSEPLTPCAVIEKLPVGAVALAPTTNGTLAPTGMLNEPAGFVATPEGRPLSVSCTALLKPFCPATETVMTELVACESEREFGESDSVKSATGGGEVRRDEEEPAPLQPAHTKRTNVKKVRRRRCGNRPKDSSAARK